VYLRQLTAKCSNTGCSRSKATSKTKLQTFCTKKIEEAIMTTWQSWEGPPAGCETRGQTGRTRKKWPTNLDHFQTISSTTCNSYTMRAAVYVIDNATRQSHCHSAVCRPYLPTAAHRTHQMIFLAEAIPLPSITAHLNIALPSVRMFHYSHLPTLPLYFDLWKNYAAVARYPCTVRDRPWGSQEVKR
jgi:ribosomal protein L28